MEGVHPGLHDDVRLGGDQPSAGYNDKQPWRWAEPFLSINRKYLKLKMRLTPYFYTHARNAADTGVPTVRAMPLEFPADTTARGDLTSQQFMAGEAFLVAPVTSDTAVRDDVYLPAGTWTDYWTGKTWSGPGWLDGYSAPLDTLPLLVKGGSIVPMWPQMNHSGEKPVTPITFDIYPRGSSTFTLYEDDGITRAYRNGASARQKVDVTAPAQGSGDITVTVGASKGKFTGKQRSRGYQLDLHVSSAPTAVTLDGATLTAHATRAAFEAAATGWFFDTVLHVKTGTKSTGTAFTVVTSGATLPAATQANGTPPSGQTSGPIRGVASNRCVDVPGANTTDGTQLVLWDCHGGPNQTWSTPGDGTIRALGKCMDVQGGSSANGTSVDLYACHCGPNQQWTYDAATETFRSLGKCLDAFQGATDNGTKLIIWDCTATPNQRWARS